MASEIQFLFACCAGRVFLLVLLDFCRFRCQKGVQNGLDFRGHGDPKIDKIRKRLRVYVKKTDKVEQTVTIYGESRTEKNEAFNFACATIDNGGRP